MAKDPQTLHADKQLAGWKPEARYSNNVLMGNWYEARMQFQRGGYPRSTSCYRQEFRYHDGGLVNRQLCTSQRMDGVLRNDGKDSAFLLHHHGSAFLKGQKISTYDQEFCRGQTSQLRSWDRHQTAWRPEKADHPLQGAETQTGLLGTLQDKWKKARLDSQGDFATSHQTSFQVPSSSWASQRYATPAAWSSHFQTQNIINKNLPLRDAPLMLAPERYTLTRQPAADAPLPSIA